MKKITVFLLIISLVFSAFTFTSCKNNDEETNESSSGKNSVVLKVYNWGEYISDGFEGTLDVNKAFEEYYYNKTGIKVSVNYSTYATNEDMYSKISSNAGSYDVIIPSDYMIQRMAEEGLLLEFDVENEIENFKYIDDEFKNKFYDTENKYSVPYTYGTVGVIYNYTMIDPLDLDENNEIKNKSWALMWNEGYNGNYKGKILQFNNPRDAFGNAMYYEKLDINSKDKSVWDRALEKLKEQKSVVQGYVNDEIFNKMTTGSAAISSYYSGDYITMKADNEFLKFYYPEEGTNIFIDAMCIPKNSQNPDLAKEYINFMLSEEAAIANAEYIGYASPNSLVYNNEEYIEYMGEEAIELLYGESSQNINSEYPYDPFYHSFDDETQAYVNGLWEELKTENSTELWVHISSITIVVAVLSLAIYSVYTKKSRSRFYRYRDQSKKSK